MSTGTKKTTNSLSNTWLKWSTILALTLCPHLASASLINLDFSDGFNGWSGEVIVFDEFDQSETEFSGDTASGFFTDFADSYALDGDKVTLSTFFDPNTGLDTFSVTLFQDFVFNLAPNTNAYLDILSTLMISDPIEDFVVLQIRNLDTSEVLDLLGTDTVLLNDWSGVNATLEFTVQDFDFIPDSISIEGLAIREEAISVPSPPTLSLLIGAVCLGFSRRKYVD